MTPGEQTTATRVAIRASDGQQRLGLSRYMLRREVRRLELDPIMGDGKAATIYLDAVIAIEEARTREARDAQQQERRSGHE